MIQDIFPHIYHNEISWRPAQEDDLVLCVRDGCVLARLEQDTVTLPCCGAVPEGAGLQYLFSIDTRAYYWLYRGHIAPEDGFSYIPDAQLRACRADDTLFACAAGQSLVRWYRANRFCGRCGAHMRPSGTERAMVCPECGQTVYPKICPAVIAAVHDGDRLLLTRYRGRPFKKYALIAGFNEIGESIEQTVHREVMEEAGLRVKNLRFYKSQPWVFTDTLLMGFYAELDGSDQIRLQEDELAEAGWFLRDAIPEDHSNISLTGEMIERFRQGRM